MRLESQALKKIKESMGTDAFPQLLFDKVFKDDIIRLRSMEDMWKSRRPPEALDYTTLNTEAGNDEAIKQAILKDDQRVWNLVENLIVFKDRFACPLFRSKKKHTILTSLVWNG